MPTTAAWRTAVGTIDYRYHILYLSMVTNPENNPCIQMVTGPPQKFNHVFIGPLPTFPENLMQIRWEVFVQSCKQVVDRQTNNDENMTSLSEVITEHYISTWL